MRIAYLTQSYPPGVSGAAVIACQLAENMARRGHRVLVVTASDRGAPYLARNGNLILLRLRSMDSPLRVGQRFLLSAYLSIPRFLDDFQPDIVHSHDVFHMGLAAASYARRARVPSILSVHGLPSLAARYIPDLQGLRGRAEHGLWMYARWLIQKFDTLIAPTRTTADIISMQTGARPLAISNGIDLRAFTSSPLSPDLERTLRNRLGLPPNVPLLLHVGRLDIEKNVHRVIRAAAQTMQETDAHLLLVGDGREKPALMGLCESLGIASRVHFPGFITVEQSLPDVYRLARLFVTASEIETQGIVLLEATASGLPIAAARATYIPEIVHHGENGLLSEPGDLPALARSMTTLIQNPELAQQMGKASRHLAQVHDQRATMDLYEELYYDLAACAKAETTKQIHRRPSSAATFNPALRKS